MRLEVFRNGNITSKIAGSRFDKNLNIAIFNLQRWLTLKYFGEIISSTILNVVCVIYFQGSLSDFRFIFNRNIEKYTHTSRCKHLTNRIYSPIIPRPEQFKGNHLISSCVYFEGFRTPGQKWCINQLRQNDFYGKGVGRRLSITSKARNMNVQPWVSPVSKNVTELQPS